MAMITRRMFLGGAVATGSAVLLTRGTALSAAKPAASLTGKDALQRLLAGNRRFMAGSMHHPAQSAARRNELVPGQSPFATILGCADSRVPPTLIFDQGLGDLFVVRVAGNIADAAVIGSIEYAAEHLHAPLVMVLGHEKCGAVAATIDALERGVPGEGHIAALVRAIAPAVERVKGRPGDMLDLAIRENVVMVAGQLKQSHPILSDLVAKGKLTVVGGFYHLKSGGLEIIA